MGEIKTKITVKWFPGLQPSNSYTQTFYTENVVLQAPSIPNFAKTTLKWKDNRFLDITNALIQSSSEERYYVKFAVTESINTMLIERGSMIKIAPYTEVAYYAYNVKLTADHKTYINTYVYTLEFSKHVEKNYATYLSSDVVKGYVDEYYTKFVNEIRFIAEKTSYVQRAAVNNFNTTGIGNYNFKFDLTDETDHISTLDRFYASFATGTNETDFRCSCLNKDSNYVYFIFEEYPTFTALAATEIMISLEPNGQNLWTSETDNDFDDIIYTFLQSQESKTLENGNQITQIPGVSEFTNLQFYKNRKVLFYLKPDELYKVEKLLMCKPENIYFRQYAANGSWSDYYPMTMNGLVTKIDRTDLFDLFEFELNIISDNLSINVNR